jgi:hypothetical protein
MDRRLLAFPAAATVCWAQQTAPAADEAKQALIGRVQTYYQLMVDEKYRQAEALIAEESKDDYYNGKKPKIKGFDLMSVALNDDQVTAKVTIKAKVLMLMPGAGAQIFEIPSPTYWKLENGQWCWYVPEEVKRMSPFGKMQTGEKAGAGSDADSMKGRAPEFRALVGQVRIDKTAVEFTAEAPEQKVVIENGLPGPLNLRLDPHAETIKGLSVTVDKLNLGSGEKATVSMRWDGSGKISDVVEIAAFPVNRPFDITVKSK